MYTLQARAIIMVGLIRGDETSVAIFLLKRDTDHQPFVFLRRRNKTKINNFNI